MRSRPASSSNSHAVGPDRSQVHSGPAKRRRISPTGSSAGGGVAAELAEQAEVDVQALGPGRRVELEEQVLAVGPGPGERGAVQHVGAVDEAALR